MQKLLCGGLITLGLTKRLTHCPHERQQPGFAELHLLLFLVQVLVHLIRPALRVCVALHHEEEGAQSAQLWPSEPGVDVCATRGGRIILVEDVSEHLVDDRALAVCMTTDRHWR